MAACCIPLFFVSFLLLVAGCAAQGPSYNCSSGEKLKCQALAGYVPENETTYQAIKDLFQVQSLLALYGANNIDPSTAPSKKVPGGTAVRVPFPCACYNGIWASDRRPVYEVKKGDYLYAIATTTYRYLVNFHRIAAVNNVADESLIQIGQQLWIPLPCSCDAVDGLETVHLAHVVAAGSILAEIAGQFGTTESTLMMLNNVSDANLKAYQVLDVPLRACNSSIRSDAVDGSLRVPSGSYALTAGNCINCRCSSSSWQLACEIASLPSTNSSAACRAPTCSAKNTSGGTISLELGEDAPSDCGSTRCQYAGYYNTSNILNITAVPVTNQSACVPPSSAVAPTPSSVAPPPSSVAPPPSSAVDLRPLIASLYAALLLLVAL